MQEIIEAKLREIEEKENVKIIAAIESGSRAWGFASPDSDYDVRFIYVRKVEDYLKLQTIRDVIEWQLDDSLDINGWDLKKALLLMKDSNPSIFEWCASPIVYRESDTFKILKEIRKEYFSCKKSLYHYWHMAKHNYHDYLQGDKIKAKKYLYVFRALLSAKWVIDKEEQPPMLFSQLVEEELPHELKESVAKLLEMKRSLPETELINRIHSLDKFIEEELESIKTKADRLPAIQPKWDTLEKLFIEQVLNQCNNNNDKSNMNLF